METLDEIAASLSENIALILSVLSKTEQHFEGTHARAAAEHLQNAQSRNHAQILQLVSESAALGGAFFVEGVVLPLQSLFQKLWEGTPATEVRARGTDGDKGFTLISYFVPIVDDDDLQKLASILPTSSSSPQRRRVVANTSAALAASYIRGVRLLNSRGDLDEASESYPKAIQEAFSRIEAVHAQLRSEASSRLQSSGIVDIEGMLNDLRGSLAVRDQQLEKISLG